jgi:hypothetical protein
MKSGRPAIRPVSARFMHEKRPGILKRKVPRMTVDEEAEAFLEQDLPDMDFAVQAGEVRVSGEGGAPQHAPAC